MNLPAPLAAVAQKAASILTSKSNPQDQQALKDFDQAKKECFADRWRFERLWTRNLHYVNMRQWLGIYDRQNGWMEARIPRGTPKPATSKPKEGLQAIRAMFTAANLGVDVRPLKRDSKSVTTAQTADKFAPVCYELNGMDDVMNEGDFWFITTGNVIYHVAFDDNGTFIGIPVEHCSVCGQDFPSDEIAKAGQACPNCHTPAAKNFTPAVDENSKPITKIVPQGQTVTTALSPLEVAFPFQRPRWKDVDRLIRLRWRTKRYYEEHPELQNYVKQIRWSKTSTERSLQIFQSLPFQTELGGSQYGYGSGASGEEEGTAEFELWERPTEAHPEGYVMRVVGEQDPIILHLESEGLPGPLPYHDAKGTPLWTFAHAAYEHVGGRVIGSSALDPVIQKFDQLNRLDSLYEMMMTRLAVPQIIKPKGQDIIGMGDTSNTPGLVMDYTIAPGGGKPEQWPGQEPPRAWNLLRQQIVNEIDAGMGTYDILKGERPAGVAAFSTMQLLVERGEARFAGAFRARAKAFRDVTSFQIEIERQFGPPSRVQSVLGPGRTYAFETFMMSDLTGEVAYDVADGSQSAKTSLGERAAIEHLKQLGMVDSSNPDTAYAVYQKLGQTDLAPAMDSQHQCALQNQEAFIEWVNAGEWQKYQLPPQPPVPSGVAPPPPVQPPNPAQIDPLYPFRVKPWYDANIHRGELMTWAVSDTVIELLKQTPAAERFIGDYLSALEMRLAQASQPPPQPIKTTLSLKGPDLGDPQVREAWDRAEQLPPPAPPSITAGPGSPAMGAGRAAANSNQNSAPVGNTPQPAMPALH